MGNDSTKHYKAFISYSHDNEEFGAWLHKQLERYKIPKKLREDYPRLPKTLYPIFRDRYELNAGDDLGVKISKALENSDALIVVCSPNSANSKWVKKEIIEFKMKHGEERIFPIIVDGVPFAKESEKYDDNLECFPEALKYKVNSEGNLTHERTEKLASDFNKSEDGEELAKLKLIAGILGIPFGEFYRRDEEQKRRDRNKAIGIWSIVSLIIIGFAIFSWVQKGIAFENEQKMQKELYKNIIQKGVQERDYLDNPLKAKLSFSKAVSLSTSLDEEKNSKIVYNFMNKIKLNNIYEHNQSEYGCWGATFSKDEKQILSWSGNKIKLWDKKSGKIISSFKHENIVQGASFNKDNTKILSWSDDKTVRLWNLDNTTPFILKTPSIVYRAIFSKDEKRILCWGNNKSYDKNFIYLWDIVSNKIIFHKEINNVPLGGVIFSKDEKDIVCWGGKSYLEEEGFLKIFNIENQKILLSLKFKNNVHGVNYNKNQDKLLIWTAYSIKIWDLNNEKYLFNTKGDDWILVAKFNNDENRILVRYGHHGNWQKNVKLWSISNSEKPLYIWEHNFSFINGATFSKDNTKVLTWGYDGMVKVWLVEDGTLLKEIEHKGRVAGAKFFDNDNKILCWTGVNTNIENNNKGSIYLWASNYSKNKPYFILKHNGIINDVKVSKNGKELLSYGSDNIVKLWKIQLSKNEKNIDLKPILAKDDTIKKESLALKYDSEDVENIVLDKKKKRVLFSLYTGEVILFDRESQKEICKFSHSDMGRIIGLSFSKDETKIYSWGEDATIKLWDIKEKKLLKTFHDEISIKGIILSEKNSNIFYSWSGTTSNIPSGKGTVRIWDIEKETPLFVLRKEIAGETGISGIALNQDETQLISWVGGDFNLDLWNTNDGTRLLELNLDNDVEYAKFIDDKNILIVKDEYGENNESEIIKLYRNRELKKEFYPLEAQVETGAYITPSGDVKALTKDEWQQKKQKYEQILKESNP